MAIAVEMPKMSDTMDEGVLVEWLAEEGDSVSSGDVIAQVETDKATMDLEVYDDGVLLKKVAEAGEGIPIGGLIAVLGEEGEDISEILAQYENGGSGAAQTAETEASADESSSSEEKEPQQEVESAESTEASSDDSRLKASPLARRMAKDKGLDLGAIKGSGTEGRIIKRDVESAEAEPAAARETAAPARPALPATKSETLRISQMRKTIARRLSESKYTSPHFYLTVDVNMEASIVARKALNDQAEAAGLARISFNDLVTKACAAALRLHPEVNSSYHEEENEIRRHGDINVAFAVAVDEGLLTPVIRNADLKGVSEIAAETRDLAERARNKQLQPPDWEGSTFTTSNLGMFGIEEFTAIINPPNACILAIGAIRDVPVVVDGEIRPGKRMKITLSCDHRIVDGAVGSRFLGDVQRFLEQPIGLLL